jgi:hypothetical protein
MIIQDSDTMKVWVDLNNALPSWAEFSLSRIDGFYAIRILIECPAFGLKPFKVLTESTSLKNALFQALSMLRYYWSEKEEETEIINQIIEELKMDGLIKEDNDDGQNQ